MKCHSGLLDWFEEPLRESDAHILKTLDKRGYHSNGREMPNDLTIVEVRLHEFEEVLSGHGISHHAGDFGDPGDPTLAIAHSFLLGDKMQAGSHFLANGEQRQ